MLVVNEAGLPRYLKLKAELEKLETENANITLECERLKTEVRSLVSDPRAIEHAIREDLGMIKDHEMVLVFPK